MNSPSTMLIWAIASYTLATLLYELNHGPSVFEEIITVTAFVLLGRAVYLKLRNQKPKY